MVKYEYIDLNGLVELLSKDKIYDYNCFKYYLYDCDNSLYITFVKTRGKNVFMKIIKEFNIPIFTRPDRMKIIFHLYTT